MSKPKLQVVVCSTRPTRQGPKLADWALARAAEHGAFEPVLVDLAAIGLERMAEPNHPRVRKYVCAETLAWSASVDAADAFVFVTPEYNYSGPPALFAALDQLFVEWAYKPAAFVSYGGQSGGLRSVQHVKPTLTTLNMMPIPAGVAVPFFTRQIPDPAGPFVGDEHQAKAAAGMLDELARWEGALRALRRPTRA
jgi:NAD(P)H-dependent FMN reductase